MCIRADRVSTVTANFDHNDVEPHLLSTIFVFSRLNEQASDECGGSKILGKEEENNILSLFAIFGVASPVVFVDTRTPFSHMLYPFFSWHDDCGISPVSSLLHFTAMT